MTLNDKSLAPYQGRDNYLFLSYSHLDAEDTTDMIRRLNRAGFRVWYDEGIAPGVDWDENIARHIEGCSYFMALVSPAYVASGNCRDELNFARDLEKPILLVYLEEAELPAGLNMRLSRKLAIHREKYPDDRSFYARVFAGGGNMKMRIQRREKTVLPPGRHSPESLLPALQQGWLCCWSC